MMGKKLKALIFFVLIVPLALSACGGGGGGGGDASSGVVGTANVPPQADAGNDVKVAFNASVAASVALDGTLSNDPDSSPGSLTFNWTLPVGSFASLSSNTSSTPTFTATRPGIYPVTLVVNDGAANSEPSVVTVTAYDPIPVGSFRAIEGNVFAIEGTEDGDYYLLGTVGLAGERDIFVERLTSTGASLDRRILINPGDDIPSGLVLVNPTTVAVLGTEEDSLVSSSGDLYVAIVDFTDLVNPPTKIGGLQRTGDDLSGSIRAVADINTGLFTDLLVSATANAETSNPVMRFVRINTTSSVIAWDITVDAPGAEDYGVDALQESDGSVIILGDTGTPANPDIYLARIDNPLNPVVTEMNRFTGAGMDLSLALEKTSTGYIVLGSSNTFGAGGFDILVVRTDASGQYQGNLSDFAIGGGGNDFSVYARKVLTTPSGFLVAGATQPQPGANPGSPDSDGVLLSLDADGRQNGLGVYGVAGGDDIAFFARRTGISTYQLAGISGTLNFFNPVEFTVSGDFWTIDIDSATLLINPP